MVNLGHKMRFDCYFISVKELNSLKLKKCAENKTKEVMCKWNVKKNNSFYLSQSGFFVLYLLYFIQNAYYIV